MKQTDKRSWKITLVILYFLIMIIQKNSRYKSPWERTGTLGVSCWGHSWWSRGERLGQLLADSALGLRWFLLQSPWLPGPVGKTNSRPLFKPKGTFRESSWLFCVSSYVSVYGVEWMEMGKVGRSLNNPVVLLHRAWIKKESVHNCVSTRVSCQFS